MTRAKENANAAISDYEKLRLERIKENKVRLAQLGLHTPESSTKKTKLDQVTPLSARRRSERIRGQNASKKIEGSLSSGDEEEEEEDEELIVARHLNDDNEEDEYIPNEAEMDEDETALQQAMAISLEENSPLSGSKIKQTKQKKSAGKNVWKFGEGEIDAIFYSIADSSGIGISVRELQRVATAHDFSWDRDELRDMIEVFDNDMDDQLNLSEFRELATKCRVLTQQV